MHLLGSPSLADMIILAYLLKKSDKFSKSNLTYFDQLHPI